MPAAAPLNDPKIMKRLRLLGEQVRAKRKLLGITAVATAEAAGISRVTLHRIERGEASVTMGAYICVLAALGLELEVVDPQAVKKTSRQAEYKLPKKILLARYPQLKRLAWQLKETKALTPEEALELYERNWRHVAVGEMEPEEFELIQALLAHFGKERLLV